MVHPDCPKALPVRAGHLKSRGESDWKYLSMNVLIIYDSVFGNTEQIAQAIGNALGSQEDVEILRVSNVKPLQLTGLNGTAHQITQHIRYGLTPLPLRTLLPSVATSYMLETLYEMLGRLILIKKTYVYKIMYSIDKIKRRFE